MNAKDVLKADLSRARWITGMLLDDWSDEDLMVRPVPGANHTAWQLGHLIGSEHRMISAICPGQMPALPEGFAEAYTKETAASDNAADFHTKSEYLELYDQQRQATMKLLEELDEARLDEPGPEEMKQLAPTIGEIFHLAGDHEVMHHGQFSVARRAMGKPVKF